MLRINFIIGYKIDGSIRIRVQNIVNALNANALDSGAFKNSNEGGGRTIRGENVDSDNTNSYLADSNTADTNTNCADSGEKDSRARDSESANSESIDSKTAIFTINAPNYDYDVAIFHRYTDLKTLQLHRQKGIFTCFDLDDLFDTFFDMARFCDLVITSTDFLKEQLLKLNQNVIVVPNCLDVDDINTPLKIIENPATQTKEKRICWYGWWQNAYVLEAWGIKGVTTISNKISPNYDGIFYNSKTIDEDLKKFDLVIIPQIKNDVNLAKTHCRALKALYLGIPVMMSDMPEYVNLAKLLNVPEQFIIKDETKWNERIKDFKDGKLVFDFDFKKAREIILEHFSAEKIAQFLCQIISEKYKNKDLGRIRKLNLALDSKMRRKIFVRSKMPNGKRVFYLFGIKIYSYQKKLEIGERK